MLKIKKQLPFNSGLIDETEYNKNQEDIKNSIKNLYIGNQSKKKTIDDYAKLTTQIREEYAKLQAKYVQLENTLQKYKDYIENRWQQPKQQMKKKRPFRKTKIPYYQYDDQYPTDGDLEDNEEDDDYFTYESISKPKRKKRIVYVDEIDGDETNEPEEVEVVEEEPEPEYIKVVKKKMPVLRKKNTKKDLTKRVGLTKSI